MVTAIRYEFTDDDFLSKVHPGYIGSKIIEVFIPEAKIIMNSKKEVIRASAPRTKGNGQEITISQELVNKMILYIKKTLELEREKNDLVEQSEEIFKQSY
ncbi:MAG: hypothetical protein Tsb0021_09270 [Chlamydiales bacterium]